MTAPRHPPRTERSRILVEILPTVEGAIRSARLAPSDADEAMQRVLIRLGRRTRELASFTPPERRAYAWVAAIREAQRVGQEGAKARRFLMDPSTAEGVADARSPESELLRRELGGAIEEAVASLETGPRGAAMLVFQEEIPQRDAARALAVSRGTIVARLQRARAALQRILREL